jgi:hypothetical protein
VSNIGQSDRKLEAQWRSMQLQIGYLRSLEDTERVRTACVTYLQDWMIHFHPERADIVKQAEVAAAELGGRLGPPHLSWKYSWIKALFGWHIAKLVRQFLVKFRWTSQRRLDKLLLCLETQGPMTIFSNMKAEVHTSGEAASGTDPTSKLSDS